MNSQVNRLKYLAGLISESYISSKTGGSILSENEDDDFDLSVNPLAPNVDDTEDKMQSEARRGAAILQDLIADKTVGTLATHVLNGPSRFSTIEDLVLAIARQVGGRSDFWRTAESISLMNNFEEHEFEEYLLDAIERSVLDIIYNVENPAAVEVLKKFPDYNTHLNENDYDDDFDLSVNPLAVKEHEDEVVDAVLSEIFEKDIRSKLEDKLTDLIRLIKTDMYYKNISYALVINYTAWELLDTEEMDEVIEQETQDEYYTMEQIDRIREKAKEALRRKVRSICNEMLEYPYFRLAKEWFASQEQK